MPLTRCLGVGARIKSRLKALGYWKHGKPDIPRFSKELGTAFHCSQGTRSQIRTLPALGCDMDLRLGRARRRRWRFSPAVPTG